MRVSVFSSAEDCLAGLSEHACDVLIADFRLDGMDGLALLREVKRRLPWLPVIMMTGYGDVPLAVAATKAGATEFIEKPLDRRELLAAIESALTNAVQPDRSLGTGLSETETRILGHILDGRANKEIARSLNRSTRTVEAHRRNIMCKFHVHNIAQLTQRAIALGFNNGSGSHLDGRRRGER
jgi:two-component system response regulator FixJ